MFSKHDDPIKIGLIIEEFLSEKGYLASLKEYGIIEKWPKIVKGVLLKESVCERVEKGIIYIRIFSAACRHEALYQKENLLKKIKDETGCTSIKDIVFF